MTINVKEVQMPPYIIAILLRAANFTLATFGETNRLIPMEYLLKFINGYLVSNHVHTLIRYCIPLDSTGFTLRMHEKSGF